MSPQGNFVVGPYAEPDKYRLLRQVGSGGEAELWQAAVSVDGADETVAVKILRAQHAVDPEQWRERWSDQVEMLRLLRHPGVVGVHEFFTGPGVHPPAEADPATQRQYLVMNWVEGIDVREWAATSPDRFEATRYLTQLAEVLDWLHSGGSTSSGRAVVHGDISPGNVIINPDGQTVLVDFGLFRMTPGVRTSRLGTEGYCAPEVARGEYSPASDRYAFGALTYFMLTGQHPPANDHALREALLTHLRPLFDGADAETVVSIVTPEATERPTAGEWWRALRPHATTAVPQEKPLPPPRPNAAAAPAAKLARASHSRRGKALIAATGGLVLALVIWVGGVMLFGTASDTETTTSSSVAHTDLLTLEPSASEGFVFTEDTDESSAEPDPNAVTSTHLPNSEPLRAPCEEEPFVAYDVSNYHSLELAVSTIDNPEDVEVTITTEGPSGGPSPTAESLDPHGEVKETASLEIGENEQDTATLQLSEAKRIRIEFEGGDTGTCAIDSGWLQA